MAGFTVETAADRLAKKQKAQRQAAVHAHEQAIHERQQAYVALLTTGATEAELAECKDEIQALLDSLEVLRNAAELA